MTVWLRLHFLLRLRLGPGHQLLSQTLGFKFISKDFVARLDVDGVLLELVPTPDAARRQGSGNARLCLWVPSVAEAIRNLEAKGVPTSKAKVKDSGILACFKDPDGNEICLRE